MAGAPEQPHECGTTLHGLSPARISAATDAMDAEHGCLAGSSYRSIPTSLLPPASDRFLPSSPSSSAPMARAWRLTGGGVHGGSGVAAS